MEDSFDLTWLLFKAYFNLIHTLGTLHLLKVASILLLSYSNLISVLLYTLGTLCLFKLASVLL